MNRLVSTLVISIALALCLTSCSSNDVLVAHPTPCDKKNRDHKIAVTMAGVSCKDTYLSIKNFNTIHWYSPKGTMLAIQFPSQPNPFKGWTCSRNMCVGIDIDDNASGTYMYTATIDNNPISDPNIIIRP